MVNRTAHRRHRKNIFAPCRWLTRCCARQSRTTGHANASVQCSASNPLLDRVPRSIYCTRARPSLLTAAIPWGIFSLSNLCLATCIQYQCVIMCIYPFIIYLSIYLFSAQHATAPASQTETGLKMPRIASGQHRPPAPQRSLSPVPGNIKPCTSQDDHPNLLQTKHILPHSFGKGLLSFTLQEGTSSTDFWSPIGRALRLDLLLGITHLIEASTIACLAPQSGWYGSLIGDLYIYAYVRRCVYMFMCIYKVEIGSFVHHLQ